MALTFEQKVKRVADYLAQIAPKPKIGMREIEQKYLRHAFQDNLTRSRDLQGHIMRNPTCVRCERVALRDRRPGDPPDKLYVTCPHCGYHGMGGPPVNFHVLEV